MSDHDERRLGETGQIHVTLAAARSYADATGLGIEDARRELLGVLVDARPMARDRDALEQYRYRSRADRIDLTASVSREDGMAVVVRVHVSSAQEPPAETPHVAGPWYISARAMRDYMAFRHAPPVTGGPVWDRHQAELIDIAIDCERRAREPGGAQPRREDNGMLMYRASRRYWRLHLIVSEQSEGPLPALVAVLPPHARAPYSD